MMKDILQGCLLIFCVLGIIISGVIGLAFGMPYIEEKLKFKKESIKPVQRITYKCIHNEVFQLSEDRTYYFPVTGSPKCIPSEEVK